MAPHGDPPEKELDRVLTPAEKASIHHGESVDALPNPQEKRALRKFDMILLPQIALLILVAFLDRSNIGNAKVFGLEEGLGLHGKQFNNISTMFYPFYILCDVPWVVCIKRFGARRVLGMAMVGFTSATIGMAFTQTYAQAMGCRLVLGAFEAGLIPGSVFIISTIWDQNSQAKRVAVIYIASVLSGAFGGLIAYSTQLGGSQHGLAAWRWLFIIEGCISAGVGFIIWLCLPSTAENAWYLNGQEKAAISARAERHAFYKGEDQTFKWSYFRLAVSDVFVLVAALTLFAHSIALLGLSIFLPTIIRGLGYTALQANYLSIPVYLFAGLVILIISSIADRFKTRARVLALITLPTILGYAMITGSGNKAVGYVAMFLVAASMSSFSVVFLTWASINVAPEYKRSVALPFILTITNCSGLVGSQIYIAQDAPRYVMGNAVSMSCEIAALLGVGTMYFILKRRNAQKARLRAEGATTNGKGGDRALDFCPSTVRRRLGCTW